MHGSHRLSIRPLIITMVAILAIAGVIIGLTAVTSHTATHKSSAISWCWTESMNGAIIITASLKLDCQILDVDSGWHELPGPLSHGSLVCTTADAAHPEDLDEKVLVEQGASDSAAQAYCQAVAQGVKNGVAKWAPGMAPVVYTYAEGYSTGKSATYGNVNRADGDDGYCSSVDPNFSGDASGGAGTDSGGTGTQWYLGCLAAVTKPSSAASRGQYQAGYKIGLQAEQSEIQSDGGARAYCRAVSQEYSDVTNPSDNDPELIAGCVAAIKASD